jgi:high-affinity iron transporter
LSFPAFLITFTDGLEAFLVIAATVAFLRKTRQHGLASAVYWGIAVSVVTSLAGAWLFSRSDNQPAWEGRFALVAAAGVAGLAVYMWRMRRLLREDALSESQRRAGRRAGLAFFVFTVLVVSRVGMHMVLLVGTFLFQIQVPALTMGIMAGLALAALIAWLWARYSPLLRLSVFVPVTVIVLAVAMAQLVSDAVQNLANANAPAPIVDRDIGPGR